MRRKHTGDKQTAIKAISQQVITDRKADSYRKYERKKTKDQTFVLVFVELVHVKLQPGDEHDVQEPNCGEEINCRIFLDQK
jgi:hypothetical protein